MGHSWAHVFFCPVPAALLGRILPIRTPILGSISGPFLNNFRIRSGPFFERESGRLLGASLLPPSGPRVGGARPDVAPEWRFCCYLRWFCHVARLLSRELPGALVRLPLCQPGLSEAPSGPQRGPKIGPRGGPERVQKWHPGKGTRGTLQEAAGAPPGADPPKGEGPRRPF